VVRQVVGDIDEIAGTLTLDDGRVFTLDDIPGNGWNRNRLGKLGERIQALADIPYTQVQADLPLDDPDRTATSAELFAQYGNRVFLDGANIVSRSTEITFTHDGDNLIPHHKRVR